MTTKEHAENWAREIANGIKKDIGFDLDQMTLDLHEILNKAQISEKFITSQFDLRRLILTHLDGSLGYDLSTKEIKHKQNGEFIVITKKQAQELIKLYIDALAICVEEMENVLTYLKEAVNDLPKNYVGLELAKYNLKKAKKNLTAVKRIKTGAGKGLATSKIIVAYNVWETSPAND